MRATRELGDGRGQRRRQFRECRCGEQRRVHLSHARWCMEAHQLHAARIRRWMLRGLQLWLCADQHQGVGHQRHRDRPWRIPPVQLRDVCGGVDVRRGGQLLRWKHGVRCAGNRQSHGQDHGRAAGKPFLRCDPPGQGRRRRGARLQNCWKHRGGRGRRAEHASASAQLRPNARGVLHDRERLSPAHGLHDIGADLGLFAPSSTHPRALPGKAVHRPRRHH
mmetsp:Transcript_48448/g.114392  ORF Transcript_48448/g.114392 Transcript_48448/m.114392 type:complete len:221 (-) Transcript_48448:138-800(-)